MTERMVKTSLLALAFLIIVASVGFAQKSPDGQTAKKRDPFVDLVDPSGRIKTEEELFKSFIPDEKVVPTAIVLKGIIWDEKRPLAIINGKVYSQGAAIAEGLILDRINSDSIIIKNKYGEEVRIDLRKKGKK